MSQERGGLDQRIIDLNRRIERLGIVIEQCTVDNLESISVADYAKLVALYGALCSRLGRLMRDRQQLSGDEHDELNEAMDEALDLAAEMLGTEL